MNDLDVLNQLVKINSDTLLRYRTALTGQLSQDLRSLSEHQLEVLMRHLIQITALRDEAQERENAYARALTEMHDDIMGD